MRYSFVIPAWNEARLIGRAVTSIHDAAGAAGLEHEVIVADDASDDGTAGIARNHGAIVHPADHRQIAATRNTGARHATGDVLVFVDADSMVNERLVRLTAAAIDGGAAGGGARCRFDGAIPAWARLVAAITLPIYAWLGFTPGAYLFATREAFDAAGGFDETVFGGEEVFMARALRRQGRFVIVKAAVLTSGRKLRHHSARELLGTLLRLATRGRRGVASREGMDVWYGPRRDDPGCPTRQ